MLILILITTPSGFDTLLWVRGLFHSRDEEKKKIKLVTFIMVHKLTEINIPSY